MAATNVRFLVKELLEKNGVTADIFIGRLPKSYQRVAPDKAPNCVVLRALGGTFKATITPFKQKRLDVYCYANSPEAAIELDLTIFEILDSHKGRPLGSFEAGEDYDTESAKDWPGVFRPYVVNYEDRL